MCKQWLIIYRDADNIRAINADAYHRRSIYVKAFILQKAESAKRLTALQPVWLSGCFDHLFPRPWPYIMKPSSFRYKVVLLFQHSGFMVHEKVLIAFETLTNLPYLPSYKHPLKIVSTIFTL